MSQKQIPFQRNPTKSLSRLLKQPLSDLPLLTSFQVEELPSLKKIVTNFVFPLKEDDRLFTHLKVPIKKKYLEKLENDHELHQNMFLFLLRYLIAMQNLAQRQRIYLIALEIIDFKDLLSLKYDFLPGLENIYEKTSDLDPFDLLVYVLRVDSRWVVEVVSLKEQKAWLIDFINPALSHLKSNVLHFLVDRIHFELFKDHLSDKFEFLEKFIARELNDYGLYSSFLVYMLIINEGNDVRKIFEDIDEESMKGFEEKILWLIYSIIAKNNVKNGSMTELATKNPHQNKQPSLNLDKYTLKKSESMVPIKDSEPAVEKVTFSSKMLKDLLKQTKQEIISEVSTKRNNTNLDQFIDEELESDTKQLKTQKDKQHLRLTKRDLKDLLAKYKDRVEHVRQLEASEEQEKSMRLMQNYSSFNYLLWFYYTYDKTTYKKLLDEYNKRLHSHLLSSLGLPPLIPEEVPEVHEVIDPPEPKHVPKEPAPPKRKAAFVPQYNLTKSEEKDVNTSKTTRETMEIRNGNPDLSRRRSSAIMDIQSPKHHISKTEENEESIEKYHHLTLHHQKSESSPKHMHEESIEKYHHLKLHHQKSESSPKHGYSSIGSKVMRSSEPIGSKVFKSTEQISSKVLRTSEPLPQINTPIHRNSNLHHHNLQTGSNNHISLNGGHHKSKSYQAPTIKPTALHIPLQDIPVSKSNIDMKVVPSALKLKSPTHAVNKNNQMPSYNHLSPTFGNHNKKGEEGNFAFNSQSNNEMKLPRINAKTPHHKKQLL